MFSNKKIILISTLVFLGIASAGALYLIQNNRNSSDKPSEDVATGVNYAPPTDEEKAAGDQQKENLASAEQREQSSNSSDGQRSVTPVITSWGQENDAVEVAGRVPGVFEEGGTCTLTLTKNGKKVIGTKTGVGNVSEVSCGFISISRSKLSTGKWSAIISYESNKAKGVSEPRSIEVK